MALRLLLERASPETARSTRFDPAAHWGHFSWRQNYEWRNKYVSTFCRNTTKRLGQFTEGCSGLKFYVSLNYLEYKDRRCNLSMTNIPHSKRLFAITITQTHSFWIEVEPEVLTCIPHLFNPSNARGGLKSFFLMFDPLTLDGRPLSMRVWFDEFLYSELLTESAGTKNNSPFVSVFRLFHLSKRGNIF